MFSSSAFLFVCKYRYCQSFNVVGGCVVGGGGLNVSKVKFY